MPWLALGLGLDFALPEIGGHLHLHMGIDL